MNSTSPLTQARHGTRGGARMYVLMFLVVFFWSCNIIAGKEALRGGLSPLAVTQLRVLGAALLFVMLWVGSGKMRPIHLPLRRWLLLAAIAGTGIAANQLTFIGGIARSNVAHTGLIVALGPAAVLVIAVMMRQEPLTLWKSAGIIIAFAGVAILTADKTGQGSGSPLTGDLILLVSTLVFAIYQVLMKGVANQFDSLTLNTLVFVMGAVMLLPFCSRAVMATNWGAVGRKAWGGMAFLIVFGSIISYLLFAYVLTELAASRAAAFNYLQPVIAGALGFWLLSERLTSHVFMGGSLILAGVYLTERERREEKSAVPHTANSH